jgi:hypothetical protein
MGCDALYEEGGMDTSMEAFHEEGKMDHESQKQWRSNPMRKVRLSTQFTNEPC